MNDKITAAINKKVALANTSVWQYGLRAIFAGIYLGIGCGVAFMTAEQISAVHPDLGRFAYALLFPWCLVMIIFLNGELTTSNMMYFANGLYRKVVKPADAAKVLALCTLFNLIGCVAIAWVLSQTLGFHEIDASHYLIHSVQTKMDKSYGLIFLDGIVANMLVNITVIGIMFMKDNSAKIPYILGIIFAFYGFEHVIANFVTYSLAAFTLPSAIEGFTLDHVLLQWLVAWIGNFVGGGVVMGIGYGFLNKGQDIYTD